MMNSVGAHCVTYSSSNISQHVIIIIPLPFFLFSSYSTIDFIFDIQLCWWRTAAGRIWISPATTTTTILQSGMKRKDRLVHLIGPARIKSIEPKKIGRRRLNNVRYERIGTIWAIDRRIKKIKKYKIRNCVDYAWLSANILWWLSNGVCVYTSARWVIGSIFY